MQSIVQYGELGHHHTFPDSLFNQISGSAAH